MTKQELDQIGILLNCKATGKPGPCKKKKNGALARIRETRLRASKIRYPATRGYLQK